MLSRSRTQRGFVALVSVVIITVVLTLLVFSTQEMAWYARADALNGLYTSHASQLAESCVEVARMRNLSYENYAPDQEEVSVAPDLTCVIVALVRDGDTTTVTVRSSYHGSIAVIHRDL